jgi:maleylacetate reductase
LVCPFTPNSINYSTHHAGGTFGLPHAETHAVILPHVIAYNAAFVTEPTAKMATAHGLFDLVKTLNIPYSLKQLGLAEADLEKVVEIALRSPYPNPAPLERQKLLCLVGDAYEGKRPS